MFCQVSNTLSLCPTAVSAALKFHHNTATLVVTLFVVLLLIFKLGFWPQGEELVLMQSSCIGSQS